MINQPTFKMNILIELFRNSFVFSIFIGLVSFALSIIINTNEINQNKQTDASYLELSLQKKVMELDNAYYNAYSKTIK